MRLLNGACKLSPILMCNKPTKNIFSLSKKYSSSAATSHNLNVPLLIFSGTLCVDTTHRTRVTQEGTYDFNSEQIPGLLWEGISEDQ